MKKIFYAIIIFAVAALPLAAVEHLWNIKDGAGSAVCKDSGSDPVNLKINSSGNGNGGNDNANTDDDIKEPVIIQPTI